MYKGKSLKELLREEGNYFTFVYKGIPCYGIRVHYIERNPNKTFFIQAPKIINDYSYKSPIYWCGYVSYPLNVDTDKINIHGGVTFEEDTFIGFDCAHLGDLITYSETQGCGHSIMRVVDTYRDKEYVTNELKNLVTECIKNNGKNRTYLFK